MSEMSKLNRYSIGVVAINKPLGSKIIECTAVEDNPMTDGQLTDNATKIVTNTQDASGNAYSVSVQATNTVKAEWIPMHQSNRMTAPDVRRGERVQLYRYADSDKFYWATLHDDSNLRKLETVVYAWSGTKDESADTDHTNSYFLEVSTHQGLVAFHTSKSNGEKFGYDIQINAAAGIVQIQDDTGNVFFLNSEEHQIQMINVDQSIVDINKKNITVTCTETYTVNAKTITENCQNKTTTSSAAYNVQSATTNIQGTSSVTIGSPATAIT